MNQTTWQPFPADLEFIRAARAETGQQTDRLWYVAVESVRVDGLPDSFVGPTGAAQWNPELAARVGLLTRMIGATP